MRKYVRPDILVATCEPAGICINSDLPISNWPADSWGAKRKNFDIDTNADLDTDIDFDTDTELDVEEIYRFSYYDFY